MCSLVRVKGCFDALDKKYVSILLVYNQAINYLLLLFTVKNDYCRSKFVMLLLLSWSPSSGLDI